MGSSAFWPFAPKLTGLFVRDPKNTFFYPIYEIPYFFAVGFVPKRARFSLGVPVPLKIGCVVFGFKVTILRSVLCEAKNSPRRFVLCELEMREIAARALFSNKT